MKGLECGTGLISRSITHLPTPPIAGSEDSINPTLLPQSKTEKLLEDHARSLGTEVFRGAEALAVTENGEAVQTIFKDRDGSVRIP